MNNPAKQEGVRQVIHLYSPLIVCLQETKLSEFSAALVNRCVYKKQSCLISGTCLRTALEEGFCSLARMLHTTSQKSGSTLSLFLSM
jgi:hypothetical protein